MSMQPLWIALAVAVSGLAQQPQSLADKSIEDLMATRVTSVSKKEQPLSRVPAAIRVITAEEIRRSGAANIPDLLRMVPGVDVAQIDASGWAISARGFSDQFSNKMLVMIDGRSVYDPLFAGTFWDIQNIPLDDIDRIEVIRGPGATMWGTNAVNGVINIITKSADQTQGALITAGGGTVERAFATARYGGAAGRNGHYRMFSQYSDRGNNFDPRRAGGRDDEDVLRGGFRADWNLSAADKLMVQGAAYNGGFHSQADLLIGALLPLQQRLSAQGRIDGGDLALRWNHALRNGSETTLQVSYDRDIRNYSFLDYDRQAVNVDFQHHFAIGARNDVVWGLGFRFTSGDTIAHANISFSPAAKVLNTVNGFVQDEIEVLKERLWLTLGIKLERNTFSGLQNEPSAQLSWAVNPHNTLWAAVSDADRIPSRFEKEVEITFVPVGIQNGLPLLPRTVGNPDFRSEHLRAFETGYRTEPSKRLAFDFATFYNRYDHLRSSSPGVPFVERSPAGAQLIIPAYFGNQIQGAVYGAEVQASWKPVRWWTIDSGYTWLKPVLHQTPSSQVNSFVGLYGKDPRNHFTVRSSINLPRRFEFDQSLSYVGCLLIGPVPAYARYDVRIGWHASEAAEFSIVGQNLLQAQHMEFVEAGAIFVPMPVKRSFYGKLTWRF
jgi:iron complex outermembrane receptor protein